MMTIGELLDKLTTIKTKDEAYSFLISQLPNNPYILGNIRYAIGYLDEKERNRISALFR